MNVQTNTVPDIAFDKKKISQSTLLKQELILKRPLQDFQFFNRHRFYGYKKVNLIF